MRNATKGEGFREGGRREVGGRRARKRRRGSSESLGPELKTQRTRCVFLIRVVVATKKESYDDAVPVIRSW